MTVKKYEKKIKGKHDVTMFIETQVLCNSKKKKNARVMEGIWNPPRQSPTHSGGQRLNYYKCLKKNAGQYLEKIYNHQHMLK